jgi:hypothetical protein
MTKIVMRQAFFVMRRWMVTNFGVPAAPNKKGKPAGFPLQNKI